MLRLGFCRGTLARRPAVRWGGRAPRRNLCVAEEAKRRYDGDLLDASRPPPRLRVPRLPPCAPIPRRPWAPSSCATEKRSGHHAAFRRLRIGHQPLALHAGHPVRFLRTGSLDSSSRASAPTTDADAETSLSERVRSVMRLLANPVVVCTASHGAEPRAMTMSSFTSLSLSPTPLVTFNVATPSRTLDAMAWSGRFNVHILAADAAGAAVAGHFTRGNAEGAFDGLAGLTTTTPRGEEPPLLRGEGVLRVLRCRVLREGPAGGFLRVRDHVVVVGEVLEAMGGMETGEFGLGYANRKYRRIGAVIAQDG